MRQRYLSTQIEKEEIMLPRIENCSSDDVQSTKVMRVCDKNVARNSYSLSEVKGDGLLHADNLQLK